MIINLVSEDSRGRIYVVTTTRRILGRDEPCNTYRYRAWRTPGGKVAVRRDDIAGRTAYVDGAGCSCGWPDCLHLVVANRERECAAQAA